MLYRLQFLRRCSTLLIEGKFPSQHTSKRQCLRRNGRCSSKVYSRYSVWFLCMSTQLSTLHRRQFQTFLVTLELHYVHTVHVGVMRISHWQALGCTHRQKSRGLSSTECIGELSVLHVQSTPQLISGWGAFWQCGENDVVPPHAWTTCIVWKESHLPREVVNYYTKTNGTLHELIC